MKPASRLALSALGAGLLAAVSGAFLSALPAPFDRISLPLILACGLIATFRPAEAVAVAVGAGFVWDALSVNLPGVRLLAAAVSVLSANLVFRRFLANVAWPSFAALNAISLASYLILVSIAAAAANRLAGLPAPLGFNDWGLGVLAAVGLQTVVSLLVLWLSKVGSVWFRSRYLHSRYVR